MPTSLPFPSQSSELPWARFGLTRFLVPPVLSTPSAGVAVAAGLAPGVAALAGACAGASVGAAVGSDVGSAWGVEVWVASGVASTTVSTGEAKGVGVEVVVGLRRRGFGRDGGSRGAGLFLGDCAGSQRSGVEAGADHADGHDAGGHAHP